MSHAARSIARIAALFLALVLAGCGTDEYSSIDMTLRFSPETVPNGTVRLTVYLLPSLVNNDGVEEPIDCDLFVGPTRSKEIFDYSNHLLKTPISVTFDPATSTAISLTDLAEGLTVFVVEALDDSSSLLALGCGKGQIVRGDKTFIPIYLELR
jgi:hypothetical protein